MVDINSATLWKALNYRKMIQKKKKKLTIFRKKNYFFFFGN